MSQCLNQAVSQSGVRVTVSTASAISDKLRHAKPVLRTQLGPYNTFGKYTKAISSQKFVAVHLVFDGTMHELVLVPYTVSCIPLYM